MVLPDIVWTAWMVVSQQMLLQFTQVVHMDGVDERPCASLITFSVVVRIYVERQCRECLCPSFDDLVRLHSRRHVGIIGTVTIILDPSMVGRVNLLAV